MECSSIPEVDYRKFSDDIHSKVVAKRIPLDGTIEITYRCNLNCVHCYCNLAASNKVAARKELNYEEICDIIDQVVEQGCLWLLFTGGEPLIRKDFIDIYTYAKKKGLIIILFTNGTLITPEIANYLKEWPPFSVEISLYGITKETYESVTRTRGSFDRCIEGIHLLLEKKIPLKLKTTVMTINLHEIWDIKRYAHNLGLDFRFDPIINPRLDGDKQPCQYRIAPQEVVKLDLKDKDRLREWKEFCEKFLGPGNPEIIYNCGAGLASFHIDPYGKLQICGMVKNPNFNLKQGKFRGGWYNLFPEIRAQKPKSEYNCARCDLFSLCDQCPGWAQLENNNIEMPVKYLCQIAHLRAEAFGIKEVRKNPKEIKEAIS
ncbi:MAG TPA: radical SAM protein [Syntrophaceae bacterium]|nr:radical SAM protein [Syntrophaceae bacterium]